MLRRQAVETSRVVARVHMTVDNPLIEGVTDNMSRVGVLFFSHEPVRVSLEIEVGRLALSVFFMAALITALAKFSERSKNGKCVLKKFSNSGVGVLYNFKSDL